MNRSHFGIIAIAILFFCLAHGAAAATVTVAPGSGSSAIQAAANSIAGTGGDVILPAGTYACSGAINLPAGVNLVGAGAGATTIQFTSSNWVHVDGRSQLRNFKVTGPGCILIEGSDVTVRDVTMTVTSAHNGAFYVYAGNKIVQNIVFENCIAVDCGCSGFLNSGEGSPQLIRNIRYTNCRATNSGRYDQFNPWMVGYDLAEAQVDIDGMVVENCIAEGSWEGGFHFEIAPDLTNIVMRNCISRNNAQRLWEGGQQVDFGQGYLVGENTQVIDCVSEGNYQGFEISGGSSSGSATSLTRCSDVNSVYAYRTTDFGYINLYDCSSDRARTWAIYGINSHDVYASNFRVTNPLGNPYPALLLGSSAYPSYNMNVNLGTGTPTPTTTTTIRPTTTTTVAPTATPGSGAQAPVAHFRADAIEGTTPFTVRFTDTSANSPTSWRYDFGDGTTSTEQNPSHTYTTAGLYTVTLRATNSAGYSDEVYVNYIIVHAGTAVQPTATPTVLSALPAGVGAPRDLDGDGRFEDVNGNGRKDFSDITILFNNLNAVGNTHPVKAFDFNGNAQIDFADVTVLFGNL